VPGDRAALALGIGSAVLEFSAVAGTEQPFYHFALLVPGNRFEAAHTWLAGHTALLPHLDTGRTVIDFDAWDARGCYCHDPAGNIVELIAHRAIGETEDVTGRFSADELIGISEIGVVTSDPVGAVKALHSDLGLRLWFGDVEGAMKLGFVGRQAHTLIVSAIGRGWLPTGRPAEAHPVDVTLAGPRSAQTSLPTDSHRVQMMAVS